MYPEEEKIHKMELSIGLLKKDVELTDKLCTKLSESIEKLQEVNTNILRMITIHEERHDTHSTTETELKEDIKELHSRITTVNREIHDRIDEVEHHITSRIDALRSDLIKHKEQDRGKFAVSMPELEKWKWIILGACISAGFLLGKIDLGTILSFAL